MACFCDRANIFVCGLFRRFHSDRSFLAPVCAPQTLHLPYGEARMRHIMSKYDADRSGSVNLEEFTHYMSVGTPGVNTVSDLRPMSFNVIGLLFFPVG